MDKEMFCMLAQQCQRQMYAIAFRILRNEADACDAVSEGILHAFESRDTVKNIDKFSSWLSSIVRNEAINILRTRKKDQALWNRLIENIGYKDRQSKEISSIIKELPDDCREEIFWFYYGGLSIREIADMRQIPVGTVKSRIYRGKKLLRKALEGTGILDEPDCQSIYQHTIVGA